MTSELDTRRRRAAYRARHRGSKEMDWLLGRFAEARLAAMAPAELECFERLIALPDPDLQRWIMEPAAASASEHAALLAELRAFHELDAPVP